MGTQRPTRCLTLLPPPQLPQNSRQKSSQGLEGGRLTPALPHRLPLAFPFENKRAAKDACPACAVCLEPEADVAVLSLRGLRCSWAVSSKRHVPLAGFQQSFCPILPSRGQHLLPWPHTQRPQCCRTARSAYAQHCGGHIFCSSHYLSLPVGTHTSLHHTGLWSLRATPHPTVTYSSHSEVQSHQIYYRL